MMLLVRIFSLNTSTYEGAYRHGFIFYVHNGPLPIHLVKEKNESCFPWDPLEPLGQMDNMINKHIQIYFTKCLHLQKQFLDLP